MLNDVHAVKQALTLLVQFRSAACFGFGLVLCSIFKEYQQTQSETLHSMTYCVLYYISHQMKNIRATEVEALAHCF